MNELTKKYIQREQKLSNKIDDIMDRLNIGMEALADCSDDQSINYVRSYNQMFEQLEDVYDNLAKQKNGISQQIQKIQKEKTKEKTEKKQMKSTYFRFLIETEIPDSNEYKRHFCTSIMALPHHTENSHTFFQILKTIDTIANTAHIWTDHVRLIVEVERDNETQKTVWIKIGNPNLIQFSKFFESRIEKELERLKD